MKKLLLAFSLLLFFLVGWVLGFTSSVFLLYRRQPLPNTVCNSELPCTCAPCLPDTWCQKCGHKSRDCPRLAWYFKRLNTNVQVRVISK